MHVVIIGAGNIGANLTWIASEDFFCDLYDLDYNMALAKSWDIQQSNINVSESVQPKVRALKNLADGAGADIVVITAGKTRQPGWTRDDLLMANAKIFNDLGPILKEFYRNSFFIVVTNPVDVMVNWLHKITGINPKNILGMGGILDTLRFKYFLSMHLNIAPKFIETLVVGEHGENMVPLLSQTKIYGQDLLTWFQENNKDFIVLEQTIAATKNAGAAIVQLLGKSAYFAPAKAVFTMMQAFKNDSKEILPCSALRCFADNEEISLGSAVTIGKSGRETFLELNLNAEENIWWNNGRDNIKNLTSRLYNEFK